MKILFIATREPTYPRVKIILEQLRNHFEVRAIVSGHKNYFFRFLEVWVRFLFEKKSNVDAVFLGFFAQPLFPFVKILWRGPIVSDAFLNLYDTVIGDRKMISERSLIAPLLKQIDRFLVEGSDLVFADTQCNIDKFRSMIRPRRSNMKRLWASAETGIFQKFPSDQINYRKEEALRALFFGSFIPLQGVETILAAAKILENKNVFFTLCGMGQTYKEMVAKAEELGLESVEFKGWCLPAQICEMARSSHILLGIFGVTDKARCVIPNKVFDALAMGKPLITGRSPAIRELLEDGRDVILSEMGDSTDLAEKILWVRDHYEEAAQIAENGFETFMKKASPDHVGHVLKNEIESLCSTLKR